MNIVEKIEAILFFKAHPMGIAELARIIQADEPSVTEALNTLRSSLSNRGIRLMRKDDRVVLTTPPEAGELIERLTKDDLEKDLGKAGLETLTIVLYKGPLTRVDIDYIRGVNSTYTLRTLLMRDLVERSTRGNNKQGYVYKPTFRLLQYLGISKVEDLPEYEQVVEKLKTFVQQNDNATEKQKK